MDPVGSPAVEVIADLGVGIGVRPDVAARLRLGGEVDLRWGWFGLGVRAEDVPLGTRSRWSCGGPVCVHGQRAGGGAWALASAVGGVGPLAAGVAIGPGVAGVRYEVFDWDYFYRSGRLLPSLLVVGWVGADRGAPGATWRVAVDATLSGTYAARGQPVGIPVSLGLRLGVSRPPPQARASKPRPTS